MNAAIGVEWGTDFGEEGLAEAYERVEAEIRAVAAGEVLVVNLDIWAAVNRVAGALPRVMAFRERIVSALPGFDVARLDRLKLYAKAAAYAHAAHQMAAGPPEDLRPLFEEAVALRAILFTDARALMARGLLPAGALRNLKGAASYRTVAVGLQMLVTVFRENALRIAGRCAVAEAELERAEWLVVRLIEGAALRGKVRSEEDETAELRARAFTLLVSTYAAARRAIQYLRFDEGDAESIAPSLYTKKATRRRKVPGPATLVSSTEGPAETDSASLTVFAQSSGDDRREAEVGAESSDERRSEVGFAGKSLEESRGDVAFVAADPSEPRGETDRVAEGCERLRVETGLVPEGSGVRARRFRPRGLIHSFGAVCSQSHCQRPEELPPAHLERRRVGGSVDARPSSMPRRGRPCRLRRD